jgi:hypothetical protein
VVLASFCTINTMTDDQGDMLLPWRQINKQAARIAMIVGFSAAAAMLAAATLPLWSGHGSVRTVLIGGDYRGTQPVWVWNFAATDAWWAVGLVFFVPFMATVTGAVAAKRSLSAAAKNAPQASNSSFGPALSERQRSAQSRKRQGKLAAEQQRFAEQNRSRLSVWSSLGATFAFLVGGGFLISLALEATGATTTAVGAWIGARSWWILFVCLILWAVIFGLKDRRRRSSSGTEVPAAKL